MRASEIYAGRVPSISKHRAINNVHIKTVVDRLDAVGEEEAADTLIWLLWWRDLDFERERFLISDMQERLTELIDAPITAPAAEAAA
jgi:hypothetical protein